jgi:hypothetical protein
MYLQMYPTNGNFANVAPTYVDIPGMYPTNGKPIWYSCSTKFRVRYTGTSLYLGEWPQITPGALLRLYTTKIKTSTARRHELTSSCRGLPPTIVFERSARRTFKGTCTREHLSHAIHGQCLHVLYVSSVHVSDQHQNKYKYSCISRYSFINLYIIDTKFKFILSNIWISVQL